MTCFHYNITYPLLLWLKLGEFWVLTVLVMLRVLRMSLFLHLGWLVGWWGKTLYLWEFLIWLLVPVIINNLPAPTPIFLCWVPSWGADIWLSSPIPHWWPHWWLAAFDCFVSRLLMRCLLGCQWSWWGSGVSCFCLVEYLLTSPLVLFGTAVRVALGHGGVYPGVFCLHLFPCSFQLFCSASIRLVTLGSCTRLAPSEVMMVESWMMFLLLFLASFGFSPGSCVSLPPCGGIYLWGSSVQWWYHYCHSQFLGSHILILLLWLGLWLQQLLPRFVRFVVCFHCAGRIWLFLRIFTSSIFGMYMWWHM